MLTLYTLPGKFTSQLAHFQSKQDALPTRHLSKYLGLDCLRSETCVLVQHG